MLNEWAAVLLKTAGAGGGGHAPGWVSSVPRVREKRKKGTPNPGHSRGIGTRALTRGTGVGHSKQALLGTGGESTEEMGWRGGPGPGREAWPNGEH